MGNEAEQFVFYRVPKILFKDKRFSKISSDAKLLYSLFLDRMSLSRKNGLIDEEKRVYIYFSIEEIQEEFGVASQKATKMIAELDDIKGCGLIHRKKQGQGKPTKIYVMKYTSINDEDEPENMEEIHDEIDRLTDEKFETDVERGIVEGSSDMPLRITLSRTAPIISKIENQDFRNSKIQTCENQNSRLLKITKQDFRKSKGNNNKYNNTEINNTDFNDINPILSHQEKRENDIEERNRYEEIIRDNIEYDILVQENPDVDIGGIVEIMLDAICSKRDYLNINSDSVPKEVVKSRLLKLDSEHINYVIECLKKNTTKVGNIKSYLLTALYNSYTTQDHYYRAEVNHDLYG